jgi:hypothetical protein
MVGSARRFANPGSRSKRPAGQKVFDKRDRDGLKKGAATGPDDVLP